MTALTHDQLAPIAAGAIFAALTGESWTETFITAEVEAMGVTADQMILTFATMAAAMLSDAAGGKTEARALAERWAHRISARTAQSVIHAEHQAPV